MTVTSPFLTPGASSSEGSLSILHLRRDHSIPTILHTQSHADESQGYAEGNVVNTRFGSFPHTTLINQQWGSQVRASVVDTGSRGRPSKKRKRAPEDDAANEEGGLKEAVTASSGFLHLLPPTPENWTYSLPHRTQVVYPPDYSYILHRIRARPGSVLIEAGSGSGSFTHASIRAVFNGYPGERSNGSINGEQGHSPSKIEHGHVFTYEYHAERHRKVKEEMKEHGLENLVTATHRDVYNDGFLIGPEIFVEQPESEKTSPGASAVFLDLPAPWLALPHLTRQSTPTSPSALDPRRAVHICTFSPCIEQAQRTVSALRRHGWIDIEMVEMAQKRIDIRREYTGVEYEGIRGANSVPQTVEEAVNRLQEVEERAKLWRTGSTGKRDDEIAAMEEDASTNREEEELLKAKRERLRLPTEAEKRASLRLREKTLYKQGRLIHRPELDLKTHTSYLVFAILPREWSTEDELQMRRQWAPQATKNGGGEESEQQLLQSSKGKSKKQLKREARQKEEEKERERRNEQPADADADADTKAISATESKAMVDTVSTS